MNTLEVCVLCDQSLSNGFPTVKLRQKGSENINKASKARGSVVTTEVDQSVHTHCRESFIDPKRILRDQKREQVQQLQLALYVHRPPDLNLMNIVCSVGN